MSGDRQLFEELCDALEAAEPRARAGAVVPLLREASVAAWTAFRKERFDLVYQLASVDAKAGKAREAMIELERATTFVAAWAKSGEAQGAAERASFFGALCTFCEGVLDEQYGEGDELPEREVTSAVSTMAAVWHDLLEECAGTSNWACDPIPFEVELAGLLTQWPPLDDARRAALRGLVRALPSAAGGAV
jgi:hypothetical protein